MFTSYLNNRKKYVELNGNVSSVNITIGVPQGSILCPFLFIVATNNYLLSWISEGKIVMYADDTIVLQKFSGEINDNSITKC